MTTNSKQNLSVSEVARSLKHESPAILITGAPGYGSNINLMQRAADAWRNDPSQDKVTDVNS